MTPYLEILAVILSEGDLGDMHIPHESQINYERRKREALIMRN